jgi:hypothetical protein
LWCLFLGGLIFVIAVYYRPDVSNTGAVFESWQIGQSCTNLTFASDDFGKNATPPLVGYRVTKSLKILREQLGHHNFLFGHTIRL